VISLKNIAPQIFFTVAKPLSTVTHYLIAWLNKADDRRKTWRHRWPVLLTILNKILLYPQNGHINKQTNIARITRLISLYAGKHFNNANLTNRIIAVIGPLRKTPIAKSRSG